MTASRAVLLGTALFMLGVTGSIAAQRPAGAAWAVIALSGGTSRSTSEQRRDVLETPVLPGSVAKIATLIAALETHTIDAGSTHVCRRVVTVNGRRYVCSHPDLRRPLTPAEALAYSCNDFFLSLAKRLAPASVEEVRTRLGFQPMPSGTDFAASLIGLDGARMTPRQILESFVRVVDQSRRDAVRMAPATRAVVMEGLTGAARYGSASALGDRQVAALAKTGTAPMPGGGNFGIVVAVTPPDMPSRGAVVVAPGGAGRDAAAIAADLLTTPSPVKLRIGHPDGRRQTIATEFDLEEYVARVVAGEGQPDAAPPAQQALAIAARTFAVANRGRHATEGFDLCDTTHCQVTRAATSASRQAAAQTAGLILTRDGRAAPVYYSAWCGGRLEVASSVWPDAADSSADRSRPDDACADGEEWSSELTAGELEDLLRRLGRSGQRLLDFTVARRDDSGRVAAFRASGFTPANISGEEFRVAVGRLLGWQRLKSTLVDVRRSPRGFRFTGRGVGHGVGLCIRGAGVRAMRGATARQILNFYYPDLVIRPVTGTTRASSGRIILAVPALLERHRGELLTLATRARDELARLAGVEAPPEVRITVHPDVNSFTRATGQPWWTAGATRGTAMDLLPLDVLRQQGQLTRTIRHEMAHVLVDARLTGQPRWVREGAAMVLASGQTRGTPLPASVTCPNDVDFRTVNSAAGMRALYARAEACFRNRLMTGWPWSSVTSSSPALPPSPSPVRQPTASGR